MSSVSPLLSAVMIKLRAMLLTVVPVGTQVLQGPLNLTAHPTGSHIIFTPLFERRLRTNVAAYDDPGYPDTGTKGLEQGTELHVQLDFYAVGADKAPAAEWAAAVSTLFRDEYATAALAPEAQPLYIDDAKMAPLITGEEQYLARFVSTAVLQFNPVTTIPQQFADQATVALVNVDERYPP
jgi:hypothetical protein